MGSLPGLFFLVFNGRKWHKRHGRCVPCMCDTGRETLGPFHSVDFGLSDHTDSYSPSLLDVRDGLELHLQKDKVKRRPEMISRPPCPGSWGGSRIPDNNCQHRPYVSTGKVITCSSMPIRGGAKQCKANGPRRPPRAYPAYAGPRLPRHPSEVTPALFHKVNLPLKTWYLLTRLIETDGCMTFIEFFYERVLVVTPFIRALRGCYSSWTSALAAKKSPSHVSTQTDRDRQKEDWTPRLALDSSSFSQIWAAALSKARRVLLHSLSHHYYAWDDSFCVHK